MDRGMKPKSVMTDRTLVIFHKELPDAFCSIIIVQRDKERCLVSTFERSVQMMNNLSSCCRGLSFRDATTPFQPLFLAAMIMILHRKKFWSRASTLMASQCPPSIGDIKLTLTHRSDQGKPISIRLPFKKCRFLQIYLLWPSFLSLLVGRSDERLQRGKSIS